MIRKQDSAGKGVKLKQCLSCQKIYDTGDSEAESYVSHGYCSRCSPKELARAKYAEELGELSFLRRAIYIQMRSLRIRYEEAKREIPEMLIEEDGMIDFRMSVRL
ncbi:MAG: hypothetical protein GY710_16780 [Desulfobacteraceae bacterium]|nr:hypothetical protein [Desulfobacteraceae bacterium]